MNLMSIFGARRRAIAVAASAMAGAGLVGCYRGLPDSDPQDAGASSGADGADTEGESPAPNTRFFRLTHRQWENTVAQLFYLSEPLGLSETFRADAQESGYLFGNNAQGLEIDQALWTGYRGAAIQIAELAVTDPEIRGRILPDDGGSTTEVGEAFVRAFGTRAFRRPLSDRELSDYRDLFARGEEMYADSSGVDAGVRVVIEAMLQSPFFAYRIETSDESRRGVIPLDDYEVASRLSYFLWDSMPDDALFDAAAQGSLTDPVGVQVQAERMLDDERAEAMTTSFHAALFDAEKFATLEPSRAFFPDAPEDLGSLATEEFERFVRGVVYDDEGGLDELLTSNVSYVNADLAEIYGLRDAFGDRFERVELPAGQRRGILTQVGFLAGNATSVNPDPIHRGKFVLERLTCTSVPPPPDAVPGLPTAQGETNREAIEALTEQPGTVCASCHATLINPYGFPFESYDATGAFRVLDNSLPVDPSTTVILDGAPVDVSDAFDLIDALAESPSVHECYAKHWVEFVNGRPHVPEDDPFVGRLGFVSRTEALSVRDIILEIVRSPTFRNRATEELRR